MIFIQIRSVVLGIHHLESRLYYELIYYAQSYAPLVSLFIMSHPFVMHSIIHMSNTSVIPYTLLDQYLTPNLNTIPNIQNMRFFCCSVYMGQQRQGSLAELCCNGSDRSHIPNLLLPQATVHEQAQIIYSNTCLIYGPAQDILVLITLF